MNIKYKVIYSPLALEDLRSIYLYISETLKAKVAATTQVNAIRKAVRLLQTLPERFVMVDDEDLKRLKMHKMPVKNYVVFYLVDKEKSIVNIVRIFYGGRDIDVALKDN